MNSYCILTARQWGQSNRVATPSSPLWYGSRSFVTRVGMSSYIGEATISDKECTQLLDNYDGSFVTDLLSINKISNLDTC